MGDAISVMPNIGATDRLQATQHGSARQRPLPINGDDGGSGVKLGCNRKGVHNRAGARASRQSKLMRAARFLDGRGILRQASCDEAAKEITEKKKT